MIPSVIGIDQGTTATKAFRLAASGQFEHLCSFEHRQIYPHPGWVEHDPRELLANIERCLESAGGAVGAGLANQGETVIAWNADTGEPIYNAIVWQDNRTQACIERLKAVRVRNNSRSNAPGCRWTRIFPRRNYAGFSIKFPKRRRWPGITNCGSGPAMHFSLTVYGASTPPTS